LEVRADLDARRSADARAKAATAIDLLLGRSVVARSDRWIALLSDLGIRAREAGDLPASELAWRAVLEARLLVLPDDHPEVQRARGNLAATLYASGDLDGAQVLFEKALEVFAQALPDDAPDLQLARQGLAATKLAHGDLRGARELFEKVLEVRSRALPADHPEVLRARQNLAATLCQLGDLAFAREQFAGILAAAEGSLPDDHPDLQDARVNLASTMQALGELREARLLFERVLAVRTASLPDDHPDVQAARQGLGLTLHSLGVLHEARALETRVLEIRERTLPPDHPDLQYARLNLALTLQALGELESARSLDEQALDVFRRTLPEDHPHLQSARGNLAETLRLLGDLQGARSLFEQVLGSLSRTLPDDHPHLQAVRLDLALAIKELDDLAGARTLEEQALDVLERTRPADDLDLQAARTNLALTLRSLGEEETARSLLEQVVEVETRTLPGDHPTLQCARANLALALQALGERARARELFEEVLDVFTRTLPDDHPHVQQLRGTLALLIAGSHAGTEGRPGTEGFVRDRGLFADISRNLCTAADRAARTAVLGDSGREAEERCARLLQDVSRSLSLATGVGVFPADRELDRAAFQCSERTRGAAVLSSILRRSAREDPRYETQRRSLQEAGEALARLAQAGAAPGELSTVREQRDAAERDLLALARGRQQGVEAWFAGGATALSATLREEEAMIAYRRYARATLGSESREGAPTESLCAFVLRPENRLERVELGGLAPIEVAVSRWRRAIGAGGEAGSAARPDGRPQGAEPERGLRTSPMRAEDEAVAARELARLLVDPLRDALAGADRLVVCPDDVVHLIPLDALPAPSGAAESGHETALLGDHVRIELRTTLLETLLPLAEPPPGGGLVALGDATFDAEPSADLGDLDGAPPVLASVLDRGLLRGTAWETGFGALAGTADEVLGIAGEFERRFGADAERHVLLRARASRAGAFALAPRARFFHLATHGWFAPESIRSWGDREPVHPGPGWRFRSTVEEEVRGMSPMLLCGLALAGANLPARPGGGNPGLVTAEELSTLDLSGCELAVLSACDTNVGVRRAGQGVASLQRALEIAGARSVITSLWAVPDQATKELMLDFYRRHWGDGEPKARALWLAKKDLRDARDAAGRARYSTRDWAAWVLTGDPN